MAIKSTELKGMNEAALQKKLNELEMEILTGSVQGTKISSIKLSMARVKTRLSQFKKESLNTAKK